MVGLAAIEAASASESTVAAATWYTASNWLTVGPQLEGSIATFVTRLGLETEQKAVELWRRPSARTSFRMPARSATELKPLERISYRKESLAGDIEEAASQGIGNLSLSNPRLGQNSPEAWVSSMAPAVASVIAAAVATGGNMVIDRINEARLVSSEGMKDFAATIGDKVREALAELERTAGGRDLRSDLLWWRQSLYSPSQRGSYRDLEFHHALLALAFDLHVLVPALTPHSVEFILREATRACGFDAEISLRLLLSLARDHRSLWKESYSKIAPASPRRAPLFTSALTDAGDAEDWLGPASTAVLRAPDAAVWLFRELQASRLAAGL
jgi:hypothetical protein